MAGQAQVKEKFQGDTEAPGLREKVMMQPSIQGDA